MIEPGFATMLCFVQTDAVVDDPDAALRAALADSMERITVDGQMSTNDMVVLQATGAAGKPLPAGLLDAVLLQLALEIVADGEGATRVGRVEVREAIATTTRPSGSRARSPTRRWSRRRCSGGTRTGAGSPRRRGWRWPARSSRSSGPTGSRRPSSAATARGRDLGHARPRRRPSAHVYFSDLTHDYVRINAEYTT